MKQRQFKVITPSLVGGGAERYAMTLYNALNKEGFDVQLWVLTAVKEYNMNGILDHANVIIFQNSRLRYSVFALFINILKCDKGAILISCQRNSSFWLFLLLPLIRARGLELVCREASPLNEARFDRKINQIVQFPVFRRLYSTAKTFCNSRDTARSIKTRLRLQHEIPIISNPLASGLSNDIKKKFTGELEFADRFRVIAVSRLVENKGLLKMVRELFSDKDKTSPPLHIFGVGPLQAAIERLIDEQGLEEKVFLKGFENDLECIYKAPSCLISGSHFEGFGYIFFEAAARGIPIFVPKHLNALLSPLIETGICQTYSDGEIATIIHKMKNKENYEEFLEGVDWRLLERNLEKLNPRSHLIALLGIL